MASRILLVLSVVWLIGICVPAWATVYVVPGGTGNGTTWAKAFGSIQGGINAAFSKGGDQVWVAKGTYYENITLAAGVKLYGGFVGNETTLAARPSFPRPNPDPNASVINGGWAGSVVTVPAGLGPDVVIDGFVIIDGYSNYGGGGILVLNSNPIIRNCVITGNGATRGAGIYCVGASPTIVNDIITGNFADDWGGGICCEDGASPSITYSTISCNYAGYYGGGLDIETDSSPLVAWVNITGNSAGWDGGGVFVFDGSNPNITCNNISSNNAGWYGGGIYIYNSSPTITRNTISYNIAPIDGGGLYIYYYSSPAVIDNIIAGNYAGGYGGGIAVYWYCSPIFTNNTIASNTSVNKGGGLVLLYKAAASVSNNIVAFNSSGIYSYYSAPTLRKNDVYNSPGVNYIGLVPGTGDISVNPQFVNSAAGDYHLAGTSPAINKGLNTAPSIPSLDYAGNTRIVGGIVDMGAYEAQ